MNSDNLDSRKYPDSTVWRLTSILITCNLVFARFLSSTHCSLVLSYEYSYRSHVTPAASRPLPYRQRPAFLPNAHGGAIGRLLPRGAFRSDQPAADVHSSPQFESTPDRRHLQHIADEAGSQDRQTNNGRALLLLFRINRVGR